MALRIQLLSDELGPLVIDKDDPIDINSLTQTVKRSEENEGIIYEIIFDLEFIKKARAYLKQAYEQTGGIDAVVRVIVYERDPNKRRWELYAEGQINFQRFQLSEDKVTVTIEQTGFERRVLNLLEMDVDLETLQSENGAALSPNTGIVDVSLHSKAILKAYEATPTNSEEFQGLDVFNFHLNNTGAGGISREGMAYAGIELQNETKRELEEIIGSNSGFAELDLAIGASTAGTEANYSAALATQLDPRFEFYRATEPGIVDIDIQIRMKPTFHARNDGGDVDYGSDDGALANCEASVWLEKRNVDNEVIYIKRIGTQWSTPGTGGLNREGVFETKIFTEDDESVTIGDKYYVYGIYRVYGDDFEEPGILSSEGDVWHTFTMQLDHTQTWVKFTQKTESSTTTCKGSLLYEAAQRIAQFITNQSDCFRSTLLGRTDIQLSDGSFPYGTDGELSKIIWTNGNNIRGRDVPIFANMKAIIDFVNAQSCIGFGFEKVGGKQILRLEKKSFFFNKGLKILSLGKVYDVKRKIDSKRFYNQIEFGYNSKIDLGSVNAIDEFITLRKYSIPIVNTKSTLKVSTSVKASGYQIENQKRLANSTKDSNFDSEPFVVCVLRDGDEWIAENGEGFTTTGIFDPDSGFNYRIAPANMLKNWKRFLSSSLIRSDSKVLKFASGDGNFTATINGVAEDGDVDTSEEIPIWDNEIYEVDNVPMSRDDFKLIKATPYGFIDFEDRFGETMAGFVLNIEHDSNKKSADIELLKVYR